MSHINFTRTADRVKISLAWKVPINLLKRFGKTGEELFSVEMAHLSVKRSWQMLTRETSSSFQVFKNAWKLQWKIETQEENSAHG